MSNKDIQWIKRARKAAHGSKHKFRLGAVIVKGSSLMAVGRNRVRMIAKEPYDCCTEHAEESVLRQVGDDACGATLYVARVGAAGHTRLARPCLRCMHRILDTGIRKVVWTTNTGIEELVI